MICAVILCLDIILAGPPKTARTSTMQEKEALQGVEPWSGESKSPVLTTYTKRPKNDTTLGSKDYMYWSQVARPCLMTEECGVVAPHKYVSWKQ